MKFILECLPASKGISYGESGKREMIYCVFQNQEMDNSKLRKSSPSSLRSLPPSKGDWGLDHLKT